MLNFDCFVCFGSVLITLTLSVILESFSWYYVEAVFVLGLLGIDVTTLEKSEFRYVFFADFSGPGI